MIARRGVMLATIVLAISSAASAAAQQLTPVERARIDSSAQAVLAATGAPGASIAVVRGAQVVYEQAFGNARVAPDVPASPAMRYAIGSVSKQFTAAAIMLLAEENRLSLDDRVSRWFPRLTRAGDVTIRQLLSMTSGYQDYWPQDYVFTAMQQPTTSAAIMQRWAGIPLDFEPGAQWQYSNTNYVIAAAIVERITGQPFFDVLRRRLFAPLGMSTVWDFDTGPLPGTDAGMWLRHATGPLRPPPKEARGWLYGAGQLAMTARDLARWNIALMRQEVLRPASWRTLTTDVPLASGTSTGYGLGINVGRQAGRRRLSHGGAVSGFTTTNIVYPDDSTAITVFVNIYPGGGGASGQIANRIVGVLFPARPDTTAAAARDLARRMYDGLVQGNVDRSLLTANASDFFTPEVLADYAASLTALGAPAEFVATGDAQRGGMTIRSFRIRAGRTVLALTMMIMPDGKVEQYIIERVG
jgi:D-alanyl-D-alanine carboxypeptidase